MATLQPPAAREPATTGVVSASVPFVAFFPSDNRKNTKTLHGYEPTKDTCQIVAAYPQCFPASPHGEVSFLKIFACLAPVIHQRRPQKGEAQSPRMTALRINIALMRASSSLWESV